MGLGTPAPKNANGTYSRPEPRKDYHAPVGELEPRVDPEDCPHARANSFYCPDCGFQFLTELFDCREE